MHLCLQSLRKRWDKAYHLYNWYCWEKERYPVPPIVVGTDDIGIFATSLYNEYCNIYSLFLYEKKMNMADVIRFIEYLDENSRYIDLSLIVSLIHITIIIKKSPYLYKFITSCSKVSLFPIALLRILLR